uniref:DNA-directed RNA polymerase RBP11-like dimerisation domain-containing protein n=1 Tax=Vombatus ursinus TaxID=29139 RepID=A0A4X2KH05_VOMUR
VYRAPDEQELSVFPLFFDGENIIINENSKVPNDCWFTINKEDHTQGNIKSPFLFVCLFYKVSHLLEHNKIIPDIHHSSYSSQDTFINSAITNLFINLLISLEEQFKFLPDLDL